MMTFRRTAVWLDPVLIIIAIAAFAYYHVVTKQGLIVRRDLWAQTDIQTFHTQLLVYEGTNGVLPSTEQGLQALVTRPTTDPLPGNWRQQLEFVPLDPWHQPYVYRFTGRSKGSADRSDSPQYQIISLGPDRIESSDDIHGP